MFTLICKTLSILIFIFTLSLSVNAQISSCDHLFNAPPTEHWSTQFHKNNEVAAIEKTELLDILSLKAQSFFLASSGHSEPALSAQSQLTKSFLSLVNSLRPGIHGTNSKFRNFVSQISSKNTIKFALLENRELKNLSKKTARINGKKMHFWLNPTHQQVLKEIYNKVAEQFRKGIEYNPDYTLTATLNDVAFSNLNALKHLLVTPEKFTLNKDSIEIKASHFENTSQMHDIFANKIRKDHNELNSFSSKKDLEYLSKMFHTKFKYLSDSNTVKQSITTSHQRLFDAEALIGYHRFLYDNLQTTIFENKSNATAETVQKQLITFYSIAAAQSTLTAYHTEATVELMLLNNIAAQLKHKPLPFKKPEIQKQIKKIAKNRQRMVLIYLNIYELYSI